MLRQPTPRWFFSHYAWMPDCKRGEKYCSVRTPRIIFLAQLGFAALLGFNVHQLFGIGDWGRDHISAASPFPKVDQATALAAEREVLSIFQDDALTGRATQYAWLRHKNPEAVTLSP